MSFPACSLRPVSCLVPFVVSCLSSRARDHNSNRKLPIDFAHCIRTDERSAMEAHTPYTSKLHNSEDYRVVRISAGRWHDPLRCKLIDRRLDDADGELPYRALSYVWGSSSVTDTIKLQDLPFQITLNLSCALRHLRRVDGEILLWVDALVSIPSTQLRLGARLYCNSFTADLNPVHQPTGSQGARSPGQHHAIDIQERSRGRCVHGRWPWPQGESLPLAGATRLSDDQTARL